MIVVEVKGNDIEGALRLFKRKIIRDGVHQSLKERAAFGHKQSVKDRAKRYKAYRKKVRAMRRDGNGNDYNRIRGGAL